MIIPDEMLPNKVLEVIYQRIVDAEVDKDLFFDGKITCPSEFVMHIRDPKNVACFISEGKDIVGGGWLNGIRENSAMAHFFTLPKIWGRASEVMAEVVEHWFNLKIGDRPALDVLIGEYPACHKRVWPFMQKLGAVRLGIIPEVMHGPNRVGSLLVYLTREAFYGR
jgi:hypothetical protein